MKRDYAAAVKSLGKFTPDKRQRALDQNELPAAVRTPVERSSSLYILKRMHDVRAVRKFMDANSKMLKGAKKAFVAQVRARAPKLSHRGLERRVHETLCGQPDQQYSVENCVSRLAIVRDGPTKQGEPSGFDRLCASEYLSETTSGPFWQLRILLVLIMISTHAGLEPTSAAPIVHGRGFEPPMSSRGQWRSRRSDQAGHRGLHLCNLPGVYV